MRRWLAGLMLGCLVPVAASAQASFPTKSVTIIVPAAPGGVTDLLGRMLAQRFTEAWGQQAIVENKPGANNQIAAEYVSKAPGDGYTLLIGPESTFVINPSLYPKLGYDPVQVLAVVSQRDLRFQAAGNDGVLGRRGHRSRCRGGTDPAQGGDVLPGPDRDPARPLHHLLGPDEPESEQADLRAWLRDAAIRQWQHVRSEVGIQ